MLAIGSICSIGSVGAVGHGSSAWILHILLVGGVHRVGWLRITLHPNFGCFTATRRFTKLACALSKDSRGITRTSRDRGGDARCIAASSQMQRECSGDPPRGDKFRRANSRLDSIKVTTLRVNDHTGRDQRSCPCTRFRRILRLPLVFPFLFSSRFFLPAPRSQTPLVLQARARAAKLRAQHN